MDWLTSDVVVKQLLSYISPIMLVMVFITIGLGMFLKKTPRVQDWMIPYILSIVSIILAIFRMQDVLEGIFQGLLVVMTATYIVNLYKQYKKRDEINATKR